MAFATINKAALPKATTTNTPAKVPAIEEAFTSEPSLRKRIYDAIGNTPQHASLFEDIARYTTTLLARSTTTTTQQQDTQQQQQHTVPVDTNDDGPAAKKLKVQNGDTPGAGAHSGDFKTESSLQFYMPDVSFAIPQRKKLTLEVAGGRGYLRTRNQTSKEVEFGVAMDKIQHVVCVPVPEKTQKQFNFCIIPEYSDGINPAPEGETASEAMVWAVNDGPPKAAFSGTGQPMALGEGETAEKLIRRILDNNLSRTKVITPDEREFVSATPEAHRKGEKAYHVKAFRGSKEGYLFLLSTGILFGFKKPLLFFAFANIESVSYTSILQRTFNLNIMARPMTSDETQEIEFSMIDQADFAGIDGYIKKHGLQDASLADTRRAKVYNVNGAKNDSSAEANPDGAGGEAHESELQKAERELDDQEDEDEEDYDPGSDDDSDGSGSSSEGSDDDGDDDDDDDDEGEEDEDDEDREKNIVAEELGSEAEDVAEEL